MINQKKAHIHAVLELQSVTPTYSVDGCSL